MKKLVYNLKNVIPLRQVIPFILLAIMFRAAVGVIYSDEIYHYMNTYINDNLGVYSSGLNKVLIGFGVFMYIYAIVVYAIERRCNLPFWYGRCQSGGSNANATYEAAIGIALVRLSPVMTALVIFFTVLIFTLLSSIEAKRREELKKNYIEHVGIVLNDLKLVGKVNFEGHVIQAIAREVIPKGTQVKAIGIDGSRLVVEPFHGLN